MAEDNGFAMGYALGQDSGGGNGGGFGGGAFGEGLWAVIILAILFGRGGFGTGFGNAGSNGGSSCGCATQADVRAAVDQQTLISKLDQQTYGLADSTYALNNAINNGFHGVDTAVCSLGYNVQSGFNTLGHQISDCCCETQRAIDGVKYQMSTDTCAIQNTIQGTTRDIIDNQNANFRGLMDFMVSEKMAAKDAQIALLQGQLGRAEQNAFITANQEAQTAEIFRRFGLDRVTCPIASYVVPNPNCCYGNPLGVNYNTGYNGGCGCGCG